jgi:hypothetical protein
MNARASENYLAISFWHTDKNFCFYAEVSFWDFVRNDNSKKGTTARLNETRFGPKKKSSPIYLSPKNLDTFWWNCQIIFRCASIHIVFHSWIKLSIYSVLAVFLMYFAIKYNVFYKYIINATTTAINNACQKVILHWSKGGKFFIYVSYLTRESTLYFLNVNKYWHHFLMKLPDNFQMREHSWPCRFHIKVNNLW